MADGLRGRGPRSAFLVGDSVPFGLREAFKQTWLPDLTVSGSTALGCGLVPERLVVAGDRRSLPQGCREWSRRWPSELALAAPTFPMVFLGIGEQFDHLVDGRTVIFGTAEYAAHLHAVLDDYVQKAGGRPEHPVLLVNVPCHGVPIDPDEADGTIINDDTPDPMAQHRWLPTTRRTTAGRARVLDLHGFLCSHGYTNIRNGVSLRTDGLHFSDAGARLVWQWIGDRLAEVAPAGSAPQTPGDRTVRAFVVGDSVAHSLHSRYVDGLVPGLSVTGSTELGCGLLPDLLVADGKRIPAEPQCPAWPDRWGTEVARLHPDVSLLMVGSWEQYDRLVDGHRLEVGTTAFSTYLRCRFEAYVDVLSASSGSVAVATVPCSPDPRLRSRSRAGCRE